MTSALSEDSEYPQQDPLMNPGHLPSTYTSLLVLGILRAPVEEWINKLDVDGLERFLDTCADTNGSYVSSRLCSRS
jgi:prenyltransferase beta subunit